MGFGGGGGGGGAGGCGGAVGGGGGDGGGGKNTSEKNVSFGKWNDPSGDPSIDPSIDPSTDPCIRKSGGEKEGGDRDEERSRRILKRSEIYQHHHALTETRRPDIPKEISKRYSSRDPGAAA